MSKKSAPVTPVTPDQSIGRSTAQKLTATGFPGLYRHENGTFYGKKKVAGVKKVFPLKTPAGENITDRKLAERVLLAWTDTQTDKKSAGGRRLTFSELLAEHMETMTGLAPTTLRQYRWAEQKIKENWPAPLSSLAWNITANDCTKFLATLKGNSGIAAASFNQASAYLARVLSHGETNGHLPANPLPKLKKEQKRKKVVREKPTVPSLEQFAALVNAIRTVKHSDTKDATGDLVEFLGLAALGEAEAAGLKWRDINFDREEIAIRRKKTSKDFYVPFYPWLKPFLIALRDRCENPEPGAKVFSVVASKKALEGACKRLGYPHFTARNLRQMGIIRLLRGGLNFKLVAKYQGHSDGGRLITDTYSEVLSENDKDYERNAIALLK